MEIKKVTDPEFAAYGKVLEGYDLKGLLKALEEKTPLPAGVEYVGSVADLEYTDAFGVLQNNVYGGMPIQIGYCNGHNTKLNCLEYHRDSEINVGCTDFILLLAKAGQAVEVYATTLHYAPCSAKAGDGFKVIVVLPKGTNGPAPAITAKCEEDKWMTACNKWLLAHAEASEAKDGAYVGLTGVNIDIAGDI